MIQPLKTNVDVAIDTEITRAKARVDKWRAYAADVPPIASRDIVHAIDDVLEVIEFAKLAKAQSNVDVKNKALVRIKAKNDLLNPSDVKYADAFDPDYTGAGNRDQTYWQKTPAKPEAIEVNPGPKPVAFP
jgi:hypothetical protein